MVDPRPSRRGPGLDPRTQHLVAVPGPTRPSDPGHVHDRRPHPLDPHRTAAARLYVTKLATSLHHTGQGLGDLLLDCAVAYGRGRGIPTLRWDAWTTNTDLHRYYTTRAGVRHLRTTGGHLSGALFELAHTARRPPDHVQITAPMTVQATLPTLAQQLPPGVGEPTGDQPPGITWFQVPDLPIPQAPGGYLNLPATHGPQPVIWHDEDHWQIHQTSTYPIHPPTNLTPGRPYTIHLTNDHTTAQILGDHI
jgi:Acetyltransferase (GNAT) family